MNKYYLILLFLFISLPFALHGQTAPDSLKDAGIFRPIDRIHENIQWNTASPDLFTYWIDNGRYGLYGPQPDIYLDGIPVDANFFGWQNLNMIPITRTHQVKSSITSELYQNSVNPAGYFDFSRTPVDDGISASGSYYVGNETGDPGPYVYDSLKASNNIDRWGPDGEISLSYKNNGWYASGQFVSRNHLPTDLASNARLHFTASLLGTNQRYINHRIFAWSRSGLVETGYKSEHWGVRGRLMSGASKDYLFLQPFGREVPVKSGYDQFAIDSYYNLENWNFTGRYVRHKKILNKRIDLHPYIFDWEQNKQSFSFSSAYNSEELFIQPGINYEIIDSQAPGINHNIKHIFLPYLKAEIPVNMNTSVQGEISADISETQSAFSYSLSLPTEVTEWWKITPAIQKSQLLPVRQHAFAYWVNEGYNFADELDIPFGNSIRPQKSDLSVYKLKNIFSITPDLTIDLQQQLIDHHTLNIPFQQVEEYEYVTDTEPGLFNLTQETGARLHLFGKITHTFQQLFSHSLAVNLQQTVSGSNRYRSYFKQIPETNFKYQVDIQPANSILISANISHRSSTSWDEFDAIDGNNYRLPAGIAIRTVSGTFRDTTPSFTNISLSVKKWLWNRRLSTQFSLNNLLNQELRMHPLGADLNTIFDANISLDI